MRACIEDDCSLTDFASAFRRFDTDFAALKVKWAGMKFAALAVKYDPNQPRVPAGNPDGGQWTGTGGEGGSSESFEDLVQPVFAPLPAIVGIEAALTLFAALSALNSRDSRAVFEFNAQGFDRGLDGTPDFAASRLLNRDEVNSECPRLSEVQQRTDLAAGSINRSDYTRPSEYGTAVHTRLAAQIKALNDPDFRAEVSLLKEIRARYGARESIRIDIFERVGNGTVCVYDIKTGAEGLSAARFREIAMRVMKIFPDTTRILISEIRPTR